MSANTDFFDEDLRQRDRRLATTEVQEPQEGLAKPVADLNLTRMARHKEEVENQVAQSAQELDRLRKRQDELERERRNLEELRNKQADYETGKREIGDRLQQSLVMMEKEEVKAERLLEVLQTSRQQFKEMLQEIEAINEEDWPEERMREELNTSLVVLDESRMEYNKTIAKVEALTGDGREPFGDVAMGPPEPGPGRSSDRGFGYWFKAGWGFSLPLIFTMVALFLAYFFLVIKAAE